MTPGMAGLQLVWTNPKGIDLSKPYLVHGCFWHQHDCRRGQRRPASNQAYWGPKLTRNAERDATAKSALACLGWRVLTIWKCEIGAPDLGDRIRRFLRQPANTTTNHEPQGATPAP